MFFMKNVHSMYTMYARICVCTYYMYVYTYTERKMSDTCNFMSDTCNFMSDTYKLHITIIVKIVKLLL